MGGAPPIEVCPCLVNQQIEEKNGSTQCEDCWIEVKRMGEPCNEIELECIGDDACRDIAICVGACFDQPPEDIPSCIGVCAFPADRDAPTILYHERMQCFCDHCSGACNATGNDECIGANMGGAGGTGGMGGAGGN